MAMSDGELEAMISEGIRLRDTGSFSEAASVFRRMLDAEVGGRRRAAALGALGGILLDDMSDAAAAVPVFRECTSLSPRSELASLGLFHSLMRTGETDAAFEEMKRYVSIAPSEEYARLLEDMREQ